MTYGAKGFACMSPYHLYSCPLIRARPKEVVAAFFSLGPGVFGGLMTVVVVEVAGVAIEDKIIALLFVGQGSVAIRIERKTFK